MPSIIEEKKIDEKGREIMDFAKQKAERLQSATNECADNARELVREHLEEQTTAENLKHFIGEKFEGLKESIQHGGHKVHEICTGHGLMEPDENKPESFKQQIGEKFEGLKEKLVGKTTADSAADEPRKDAGDTS
jgi:hypothetical protein